MARLPNHRSAILDIRKLEEYCLNSEHPRGQHKARVFYEALGINQSDASWLHQRLLSALQDTDAEALETDAFGTRWRADLRVARQNKEIVVRTIWIIRTGEDQPRFVTCWVL
ncbi:hypothetical protein FHS83_001023 [Rhizomicrobium palustre]|uniref:DUF6883 domain-containing protein n=1 Tax=Rhizomicrobium palustre TaxID=189966 RepID=A0A846MWU8_9PROT|nr:DUF6883 domain-containing protein [Rhizomicrobium palustre]NIK87705.1 hypothetical protein [Rhizomicrobium palustre]